MMKLCYFAYPLLPIILAAVCPAESLVLRSGVTVSGKLLAMDQRLVRIERCGREEQYAREDVKTIGLDGESSAGALCDGSESAKSELASTTALPLRLLDYLDSEHEPAGQVFRAEFDAPLKVEGRVILPLKTAVLLRMVDLGGSAGHRKLALDLVGIKLGRTWTRVEPVGAAQSVMSTVTATTGDLTLREIALNNFQPSSVSLTGERIFIPPATLLTFTLKRTVRLVPEKR